jgi:hypothetical protein
MATSMSAAALVVATVAVPAAAHDDDASLRVCRASDHDHGCRFSTIQAAIDAASDGATISIDEGTYPENLMIDPAHTRATHLTLVGEGSDDVIVDGQHKGSVVAVSPGISVKLVGLTLTHGSGNDTGMGFAAGGGILNFGGSVEVIHGRVVANTVAVGFGGGIFNTDAPTGGGTLKLVSSVVRDNTASAGGGVSTISMLAATHAQIINTTLEGNHAGGGSPPGFPSGGGGVQNCGTLTMTNSPIRDNTASDGGGLTNCGNGGTPGTATLTNSPITGNHAIGQPPNPGPFPGHGGGVSNGGMLMLINSPVRKNVAVGVGGGIFNAPASPLGPAGTVIRIHSPVTDNIGNPPSAAQCFGTPCP